MGWGDDVPWFVFWILFSKLQWVLFDIITSRICKAIRYEMIDMNNSIIFLPISLSLYIYIYIPGLYKYIIYNICIHMQVLHLN